MATPPRKRKPLNKANRAVGRSISDFPDLTKAELRLIDACRIGKIGLFGDERPKSATEANSIRATLIRFLALGGDDNCPVHEHGLHIVNAWIKGELDLQGSQCLNQLYFSSCVFDSRVVAYDAHLAALDFDASELISLSADRLVVDGPLNFRKIVAKGEVRLLGAVIGGNFDCRSAHLYGKDGVALRCDRMVVKGNVFFDGQGGSDFLTKGEIRLLAARIDGSLYCRGCRFENEGGVALNCDRMVVEGDVLFDSKGDSTFVAKGQVRLLGVDINGDLSCRGGRFENTKGFALDCEGLKVKGTAFTDQGFSTDGVVSFANAKLGSLKDDCLNAPSQLILDGLVYKRFANASTKADERINWLKRQVSRVRTH